MAITQVGYYQIDRLLGEGGMGAVYQATHQMTGRRVAIKTLRPELAERADLNARFFNEARTMSFLEHPSIVRVHDVGRTPDGTAYMVMDLCEGPTLGEVMRSEPRAQAKLGLLAAVADALAHAHRNGVIHRDLKPDNVIVTSSPEGPRPRVLDFGIAKVMDGALAAGSAFAVKTRTGTAMGTPLYMSPEQCRGVGGITQATDVYALGIMLYEALAGRVPFNGGVGEVIVQHITAPAPALDVMGTPGADASLSALVARMLEKEPTKRPTMIEVVAALSGYATERADVARSESPEQHAQQHEQHAQQAQHIPAPMTPTPVMSSPTPTMLTPTPSILTPVPPPAVTTPPRAAARAPSVVIPLLVGCLIAGTAIGMALLDRRTEGTPKPAAVGVAAAVAKPEVPRPTVRATPPRWRIESTPEAADVFAADGALLGRTPFVADALIGRGERLVYVRLRGYADELVRYDGSGSNKVRLREQVAPRAPIRPKPSTNHDDFEITPLH